jgi:hypothetical protein
MRNQQKEKPWLRSFFRGEPSLNPTSTSYRADWWIATHIGVIGGIIMGWQF